MDRFDHARNFRAKEERITELKERIILNHSDLETILTERPINQFMVRILQAEIASYRRQIGRIRQRLRDLHNMGPFDLFPMEE